MKTIMNGLVRDEKGAGVLALVLVLLVVGGLVLTPLLGLMGTGLATGTTYERKTDELYAADAGVEDAILKIQNQDQMDDQWAEKVRALSCQGGNDTLPYTISGVNGKSVAVTIVLVRNETYDRIYSITSIATSPENNSQTTIESYVRYTPARALDTGGDNATQDEDRIFDLDIFKNYSVFNATLASSSTGDKAFNLGGADYLTINGGVYYCGGYVPPASNFDHDEPYYLGCGSFPTSAENDDLARALKELAGGNCTTGDVHITSSGNLGPKCIDGNLYIDKSVTLTLKGVVYVTKKIAVGLKDAKITINGSGSLVADLDIDFFSNSPTLTYDVTDSIIMTRSYTVDKAIKFKYADIYNGTLIYAPNGGIWFDGYGINVTGSAVGKVVKVNQDDNTFNPKPRPEPPVVLPASLEIVTYTVNPESE
jgi:hypothetical protein